MKTVVIVHHTGEWGGGTKSLVDLCEMLRDDYHVIVCIPKGFPDFAEMIGKYGCGVHELSTQIPFTNIYSGRPPLLSVVTLRSLLSIRNIKSIGEEILTLKPDIVIFNTIVTAISARYLHGKTKVICVDRETLSNGFAVRAYRLLLDKHLDAITCLSEFEKKKLGFRNARSYVFPDCVKMDALVDAKGSDIRRKENISIDKFIILYMGGLNQIKGADVILKAMDILDDRFQLVMAGDINSKKFTNKQLLHDLKYPSIYLFKKRVIKYLHRVKGTSKLYEAGLRNTIDELIIASDIVVFPSTSVHQPRPCIEAGAYGKPVIISDYPETKEYFRDGYNALTFKPGDAVDLARKLKYACENREIINILGEHNLNMTRRKHDFSSCKDLICMLIEKESVNENQN